VKWWLEEKVKTVLGHVVPCVHVPPVTSTSRASPLGWLNQVHPQGVRHIRSGGHAPVEWKPQRHKTIEKASANARQVGTKTPPSPPSSCFQRHVTALVRIVVLRL
jgi:hypothetical protein